MLLNDIGKTPNTTLRKINQHLEANYGFKISENASDKDLVLIMEQLEGEIINLKIKGDNSEASPEISKRLLVLEGLKTLREFAMTHFQSPKFDVVINGLAEYVIHTFEISGCNQSDFEHSMARAMEEYRSSQYRFPDDMVEQQVRQYAMAKLQPDGMQNDPVVPQAPAPMAGLEEKSGDEYEWHSDMADQERMRKTGKDTLSTGETVSMVKNAQDRYVPDPFELQKIKRTQGMIPQNEGKKMKEQVNLVKNLRRLLETEVSQAEVMMAAKGFAQELQEMVEKIGRLQNEDLPPVTDQMRETYGMRSASAFQTQIYGALQNVMDSLYTAKGQVDDAVTNMATTGQFSAPTDMDLPVDDGMDGGMDDVSMDADLDNIEGDLDMASDDEFGGAAGEEPLGRAMKESALQAKITEMKRLVDKARSLKEMSDDTIKIRNAGGASRMKSNISSGK
jgi:hypothetical protein